MILLGIRISNPGYSSRLLKLDLYTVNNIDRFGVRIENSVDRVGSGRL